MKQVLIFLAPLLITGALYAQSPTATRDTHNWAGGACCVTGTDITITISIPVNNEWSDFDSLYVCNGQRGLNKYSKADLQPVTRGDTVVFYTLRYRYTQNSMYEEKDIVIEKEPLQTCTGRILMTRGKGGNRKTTDVAIIKETQSFTAYP